MTQLINIPDIGDDEVTVTAILVKEGDSISIDQDVISLEGDKASMDVPSPAAGTISKILLKVGDAVKTGSPLFELTAAASASAPVVEAAPAPVPEATATEQKLFNIPDIGDDEVTVTAILIKEGDSISIDQDVISLEGDKASMDVPSPAAGTVSKILLKVGDAVKTGSPLFELLVGGAAPAAASQAAAPAAPAPAPVKEAAATAPAPSNSGSVGLPQAQVAASQGFVHAAPAVRRKARKYGVNLDLVKATGEKNRIRPEDIEEYIKTAVKALVSGGSATASALDLEKWPSTDFSKFGKVEVKELSKIQKISGRFLHRNWVYIPHVTQFEKADITELEAFRKQQNEILAKKKSELKITPLVFILKAVAKTLEEFPKFNSSLNPNADSIIYKDFINIGVAVDTPNGLVVPVFKDVNKKGIFELSQELAVISKKARDGKLTASDMSGGTFTISSLGGIGGTSFTPIVNAPEVAILGLSRSAMEPVYNGKDFTPRLLLPLCLSYDHRAIDGADGARFIVSLSNKLKDLRTLIL